MIISLLTNGFGNNIFQCVAGKLLSIHHKVDHFFICEIKNYNCINFLESLGFKHLKNFNINNAIVINQDKYNELFNLNIKDKTIILKGFFEDKNIYENNRDLILSFFPKVNKTNNEDLVFHFRTGDRLFYKNEFNFKPSASSIKNAIDSFDFNNLYIVTDMYEWKEHTSETIKNLNFHVSVNPEESVDIDNAVSYYNNCFNMLQTYNPIVKNNNVLNDFNFIRSFDKILFQHGTMSWWASFLSDASRIGVYGPWRQWKGLSNKNLSEVSFKNWFQWK